MKPTHLAFLAVCCFALENALISKYLHKISACILLAIMHAIVACIFVLIVAVNKPGGEGWITPTGFWIWVLIVGCSAVFGLGDFWYLTALQSKESVGTVTLMIAALPVIATLISSVLNKTLPTLDEVFAWVLVFGALVVLTLKPFSGKPPL